MSFICNMDSWWWRIQENLVYHRTPPLPRVRTKPMQVICVGFPRSATESLSVALDRLGLETYHGWNVVFDQPTYAQHWIALCRKKFYGRQGEVRQGRNVVCGGGGGGGVQPSSGPAASSGDGDCDFSAKEFDEVFGHCVAIADTPAALFAAELYKAYPGVKVILNTRADRDKWYTSVMSAQVQLANNWLFFMMTIFSGPAFWPWHVYHRFLLPLLFRASDGDMSTAIRHNAKWVYREHCDMIRGMVPKERLLEWTVEDGWGPVCKFLDKQVPKEDFPSVNAIGSGWEDRQNQALKLFFTRAVVNFSIILGGLVGAGAVAYRYL